MIWVVIGASSAIAREFARQAAMQGAGILLAGRDAVDLEAGAADIAVRANVPCRVAIFDLADSSEHENLLDAARDFAMGGQINVFLAAGTMPAQSDIDLDPGLAASTIVTNYTGAVLLLQRFAPIFEAQKSGAIVALGSVAGDRGRLKNYVYGSAKAGLHAYLQGLRARLFRAGAHVVTVKPGFVDTAMTWGLPGLFLVASPKALGAACLQAAVRKRDIVYVPFFWWGIMTIIKNIPERIFKKLNI
jgi:decaprenylphospho-beta-D-erythro-pentofuranosid-2-ulose 2-reductase